ncbi:MAG: Ig-like domain-containing protein [Gemmatimonadaceae bacterium]
MLRAPFSLLALAVLLVGCGGGDAPVAPATASSVGLRFPVDDYAVRVGQATALGTILEDVRGRSVNPAKISWSSSAPAIASVTADGVVVGVSPGSARILAASGALSAQLRVVVSPVPVAAVGFIETPAEVVAGSTVQLRAVARDSAGGALIGRTISYGGSDSAVASISATGLLTALGEGPVTITAESEGRIGALELRVVALPVASVELVPSALALEVGGSGQFGVVLRDAQGRPLASRPVTFRSSDGTVATVDGQGVVRAVGAGSAAVVAEVDGISAGAPVSVRSAGGTSPPAPMPSGPPATVPPPPLAGGPGDGGFDIVTRFVGTPDDRAVAVIARAVARWSAAIGGDLPDVPTEMAADACAAGQPASRETVDDLLVLVRVVDIDGLGSVLARAGPCVIRSGSGLPVVGVIDLDRADLGRDPRIVLDVVSHELGHVLGIGTLWSYRSLVYGRGSDDPLFLGETAQAAYRDLGAGSALVPVENSGGIGTRGSHWRESTFRTELMTGWIGNGVNVLSGLTIASLRDLGYAVNMAAAESYALPPRASVTARLVGPTGVAMRDELIVPRFTVDADGRTRRLP